MSERVSTMERNQATISKADDVIVLRQADKAILFEKLETSWLKAKKNNSSSAGLNSGGISNVCSFDMEKPFFVRVDQGIIRHFKNDSVSLG